MCKCTFGGRGSRVEWHYFLLLVNICQLQLELACTLDFICLLILYKQNIVFCYLKCAQTICVFNNMVDKLPVG